jgi:hypothetical protein
MQESSSCGNKHEQTAVSAQRRKLGGVLDGGNGRVVH